MTGKNSADIHLVVDAMDLSYSKEHIDTFVIVSGDSDFSPLVAKLKENGKRVLGLAMRNSTSELLVSSCDEFIFYEDLEADEVQEKAELEKVAPGGKRDVFRIVLETLVALQREISGPILASMIKDTIRRKQPSFSESSYGYRTFSALLEDAQAAGLLRLSTDPRSGTYVVTDFKDVGTPRAPSRRGGRRRSARRPSGRDEGSPNHVANGVFAASDSHPAPEFDPGSESPGASRRPPAGHAEPAASSGGRRRPRRRRSRSTSPNPL
jgi:NYN domain-containing protein